MKIEKFIELVDDVLNELKSNEHKESFKENMEHLEEEDKKFSEWMMTYLAWSELGSEKDCATFYWNLENED